LTVYPAPVSKVCIETTLKIPQNSLVSPATTQMLPVQTNPLVSNVQGQTKESLTTPAFAKKNTTWLMNLQQLKMVQMSKVSHAPNVQKTLSQGTQLMNA
jgi:hypothetical protein